MKRPLIILLVSALLLALAWLLPHSRFGVAVQTPTQAVVPSPGTTVVAQAFPSPSVDPLSQDLPASYGNVSFTVPVGLAMSVDAASMPASAGPLNASPAFIQFALKGYQFEYPDSPFHPQVRVYPTDEYAALSGWAAESLRRLRSMLVNQYEPVSNDSLPNVPYMGSSAQLYGAQVKQLLFQNGSGVRMISSYAQYPAPVSQRSSFYHYEGLTQDGKYVVVVEMPVVLPVYADESNPGENGITYVRQDWSLMGPYYQSVTDPLNNASPDGFNPMLSRLDALVQSITVGEIATSAESPCPTPAAGTALLTDIEDGYCLLYPEAYSAAVPNYIVVNPISAPGDTLGDAWVSIEVEKALGQTADQVASVQIATVGPGYNITRSTVPVDDEQAVVVDGLPGPDPWRKVYLVHDERLYTLTFLPWSPTAPEAAALENLYTMVMDTLHFVP